MQRTARDLVLCKQRAVHNKAQAAAAATAQAIEKEREKGGVADANILTIAPE